MTSPARALLRAAVLVSLLLAGGACKKQEESPASHVVKKPQLSPAEIQRSQDACKAYVDRVCACTTAVPAVARQCELAKALPEAVRIGVEVSASPDSTPDDVELAQTSVRKTVKECIEQTAKLPAAGCP